MGAADVARAASQILQFEYVVHETGVCPEKDWDVCIHIVGILGADEANKILTRIQNPNTSQSKSYTSRSTDSKVPDHVLIRVDSGSPVTVSTTDLITSLSFLAFETFRLSISLPIGEDLFRQIIVVIDCRMSTSIRRRPSIKANYPVNVQISYNV